MHYVKAAVYTKREHKNGQVNVRLESRSLAIIRDVCIHRVQLYDGITLCVPTHTICITNMGCMIYPSK